jgi:hypothetical protein
LSGDSYAQAGRKKRQKVLATNAETPKHRSGKDTKRWCRGVPGREHVWLWREWRWSAYFYARNGKVDSEEYCKNCKKLGRRLWGFLSNKLGPAY